jgi:hypothetical protein
LPDGGFPHIYSIQDALPGFLNPEIQRLTALRRPMIFQERFSMNLKTGQTDRLGRAVSDL